MMRQKIEYYIFFVHILAGVALILISIFFNLWFVIVGLYFYLLAYLYYDTYLREVRTNEA